MKVFLSHSIAESDGPVASRLRAVAAAYGVMLLLPDRGTTTARARALPKATRALIEDADAVLALITDDSTNHAAVRAEIDAALSKKKPLVLLTEGSVSLTKVSAPVHVVRFDRSDPAGHEEELGRALDAIKARKGRDLAKKTAVRDAIAIGAIAGIAVGLLALGAASLMLGPDEPQVRVG